MESPADVYVLVTPARNEAETIGGTIASVASQSLPPLEWVIIDDGSTDGTHEIAQRHADDCPFIRVIRRAGEQQRSFGSKVHAIRRGLECLEERYYRYIGFLDADVTFGPEYYREVLQRFARNRSLGIAGGVVYEPIGGRYLPQRVARHSVAGAVQTFRRECYEEIGGYQPLPGGIDAVAEITARMKGWQVRSYPELPVRHHRRVGDAAGGVFRARRKTGAVFYGIGYHPLFMLLRCLKKTVERPRIIGAAGLLIGYCEAAIRGKPPVTTPELRRFLLKEQTDRLRRALRRVGKIFRRLTEPER